MTGSSPGAAHLAWPDMGPLTPAHLDRLAATFDAVAGAPRTHTTRAVSGAVELRVHHDDPQVGVDVARTLWPASVGGQDSVVDVHCATGGFGDAELAALAPAGRMGWTFSDDGRGMRWLLNWTDGEHIGYQAATGRAVVIWGAGPQQWFAAAPFRHLIVWLAAASGALLVHGASAGRPEGGVLLLGSGGAGKSTTAMAVLAAGGVSTGDDYEWVELGGADGWEAGLAGVGERVPTGAGALGLAGAGDAGPPRALSCFRSFKSRHSARVAAPSVVAEAPGLDLNPEADEPKRVHFVGEAGEGLVREQPVLGVVTLEPPGSGPAVPRRIPASLALVRAAPSTVLQATHLRQEQMARLTRLITGLPCFSLPLEPDLDLMGAAVLGLVDELISGRLGSGGTREGGG